MKEYNEGESEQAQQTEAVWKKITNLEFVGKQRRRFNLIFQSAVEDRAGLNHDGVEYFLTKFPNRSAFDSFKSDFMSQRLAEAPNDTKRTEEYRQVMEKFVEVFYG